MADQERTAKKTALPPDLLMQLRNVVPKRTLHYSEALTIAKLQARRARHLLAQRSPHATLDWILELPNTIVRVLPAHEIRRIAKADASGLTQRLANGDYFIAINMNASHTHRRFTIVHEAKHLLDYPYCDLLYSQLGHGDKAQRDKQIERICDQFAAHFLVPANLLQKAWTNGFRALDVLAAMFGVSVETIQIRLENEGFTDAKPRPLHTYFRRTGMMLERDDPYCRVA